MDALRPSLIDFLLAHCGPLYFASMPSAAWSRARIDLELRLIDFVAIHSFAGRNVSIIAEGEIAGESIALQSAETAPNAIEILARSEHCDRVECSEGWSRFALPKRNKVRS
jgi:hypothetical protein